MLWIGVVDGENAMQFLMVEIDHGGGIDLCRVFLAEQEFQFVRVQHVADGLVATE